MTHAKHRVLALVIGGLFGTATVAVAVHRADAQPTSKDPKERAKQYYQEGRKQYDLGNFQKSVELFKKAYEEWPDGAFLFNIAQAYRQLDDCKQAQFFYKRFLSVKKDVKDEVRREIEGHLNVLEECIEKQEDIRNRKPDGTNPPDDLGDGSGGNTAGGGNTGGGDTAGGGDGGGGDTGGDRVAGGGDGDDGDGDGDDGDDGDGGDHSVRATVEGPKLVAAHVGAGGALVGAGSLEIPVQISLSVSGGYPIKVADKMVIDVGAGLGLTPVPWTGANMEEGNAMMFNILANVGATYEIANKISARADLGAGVLLLSGLGAGNPFTVNAQPTTGALSMLAIRVGLTGEYAITQNIAAAVTPVAFSFSPAKDGLKDDISSLTRLEFMVGVGYRK